MILQETAQLRNLSEETTQVTLEVIEFTEREKFWRAFKKLGLFWAIALPCLLIPFLHFVLVPGFTLAGIYAFVKTMEQSKMILSLNGQCPSCKKNISFANLKYESGIKDVCPECRQDLKVVFVRIT